MSREALDLVRRAARAAARRPEPDFKTMDELFHPDHVLVSVPAAALGEGEVTGGRGYRDWLTRMQESMPFEMDLEGAVDIGPDVVLLVTRVQLRGAASGIAAEQRMWTTMRVAGGRITRTEVFLDPREAVRAAAP